VDLLDGSMLFDVGSREPCWRRSNTDDRRTGTRPDPVRGRLLLEWWKRTVRRSMVLVVWTLSVIHDQTALAQDAVADRAARGYEILRTHQFLPPDFDNGVFANLWTVWPEPERSAAEQADPASRRKLTFSYYGLMPDPDDKANTKPALGYVADDHGNWVMNCLACHGGKVAGRVIPGLPNSHIALQTLTEDVRLVKLAQGKTLSHLDLATLQLPLSTTNGYETKASTVVASRLRCSTVLEREEEAFAVCRRLLAKDASSADAIHSAAARLSRDTQSMGARLRGHSRVDRVSGPAEISIRNRPQSGETR
jgi:hypothetical protein